MIGLWMLYAAVVALLLGGAAAALERVLRLRGRPARGVWAAALAGSWVLPVLTWLRPPEVVVPAAEPAAAGSAMDPALLARLLEGAAAAPATARPWVEPLGDALVAVWAVLAVGGLALFALALRAVARRSRRWPTRRVLGEPVRISEDFGPAVVGLRRPEIVLPGWILELSRTARHLVVRHEKEHRDARDTLLLAAGTVAALAAPWNPALWWQLRRLRLAVELDCDGRVLRSGVSRRSYGDLLLSVGERMGGSVVPVAALAEPPSFLERRLRMITERRRNGSAWAAAAGVAAAALLVAAACEAPAPTVRERVVEVVETAEAVEAVEVQASEAEALELAEFEARETWTVEAVEVEPVEVAEVEAAEVEVAEIAAEQRAVEAAYSGRLRALEDEPLVVVDGVIQARGTVDLDALDIESLEVLKGEAAAALYGSRASGGVISIATTDRDASAAGVLQEVRVGVATPDERSDRARAEIEAVERVAEARRAELEARASATRAELEARVRAARVRDREPEADEEQARAVFRVRQVEVDEPTLTERAWDVAGRGLRSALNLIAEPLLSRLESSDRPLVVVDGEVWSESELQSLDNDRIDRLEVLKGDAAREEWGARGENGVVKIYLRN